MNPQYGNDGWKQRDYTTGIFPPAYPTNEPEHYGMPSYQRQRPTPPVPQFPHPSTRYAPYAPIPPQPVMVNNVSVGYTYGHPRKRVNHILHLILTVLTAGLWLPVWIIISMSNS